MYIPSLRHIATIPCSTLPADIRERHIAREEIFIDEIPSRLITHGKASLTSETKTGSIAGTATITCHTPIPLEIEEPLAFIAYTHEGTTLLLGAWEPPFPEITQLTDTGDTPSAARSVTITSKWSFPAIPVTILNP